MSELIDKLTTCYKTIIDIEEYLIKSNFVFSKINSDGKCFDTEYCGVVFTHEDVFYDVFTDIKYLEERVLWRVLKLSTIEYPKDKMLFYINIMEE